MNSGQTCLTKDRKSSLTWLCFFFSESFIAYLRNCFLASGGSLSITSCFIKIFAEFFSLLFCTSFCFFRGTPSIVLLFSIWRKCKSKSYTIGMSVQFVCQRGVGGLFIFRFLICAGTPMYIREGGPVVHEQRCDILSHWHDFTWQRIVVRGATFCAFNLARQVVRSSYENKKRRNNVNS